MSDKIRSFTIYRRGDISATHTDDTANAPDEPQFEGVVFTTGKTVICWKTATSSVSVFESFDHLMKVHGHIEYDTEIVWDNGERQKLSEDMLKEDDSERLAVLINTAKTGQSGTLDGTTIDQFTARLIILATHKLSPDKRKQFLHQPIQTMVALSYKLITK